MTMVGGDVLLGAAETEILGVRLLPGGVCGVVDLAGIVPSPHYIFVQPTF
jgi:hypothetical protein